MGTESILGLSSHQETPIKQGRSQTSEKDEASLECRRREPLGGSGGMSPQENFEI